MNKRGIVQVRIIDPDTGETTDQGTAECSTLSLPDYTALDVYWKILAAYREKHKKDACFYNLV